MMAGQDADGLESVRRELRRQLQAGAEVVHLGAPAARLLGDELGRLAQSNERLRRQNRRLRRRLQAAGLVEGDEPEGPPAAADAVP